jgi:hypothetical protein
MTNTLAQTAQKHKFFNDIVLISDEKNLTFLRKEYEFVKNYAELEAVKNSNKDSEQNVRSFKEELYERAFIYSVMRFSKFFEHVIMKKYLSYKDSDDFEIGDAIAFLEEKKVFTNQEEVEAASLFLYLSELLSENFIFEEEGDESTLLQESLFTQTPFPELGIDPEHVVTVAGLAIAIVNKIYEVKK